MILINAIYNELIKNHTFVILLVLILTFIFVKSYKPLEIKKIVGTLMFFLFHLFFIPITAYLKVLDSDAYNESSFITAILLQITSISLIGLMVFKIILPKLKINLPLIMQDLIIAGFNILTFFTLASKSGYNLSGLIATSAVITAIIGFSLQDALINIMGGLAVQMDNSIQVGDWIKIDDKISGKVIETRWRYTSIETRNWETVIIPNSLLVKTPVSILGRRTEQPIQWRRWVYFYVDFKHSPSEIIEIVENCLKTSKINNVSDNPQINCIVMSIQESTCCYAVRYWLTDLAADDPTDSEVRIIIYNALMRVNIELAVPIHSLLVTNKNEKNDEFEEVNKKVDLISHLDLFSYLEKEEIESVASQLRYAPFKKGEIITRINSEAHWLYILAKGTVSINIPDENTNVEIAQLKEITFFGEMSLMTGEKRSATVIALTNVECYRLDKTVFQNIIHKRPEIAEIVAGVLAERKTNLEAAKHNFSHEHKNEKLNAHKNDILNKIRYFFSLNSD